TSVAARMKTDSESLPQRFRDISTLKILLGPFPSFGIKRLLKKRTSCLEDLQTFIPLLSTGRLRFFIGNSCPSRQLLHSQGKLPTIIKLNKLKNVTAYFTSKAMEKLFVWTNRK